MKNLYIQIILITLVPLLVCPVTPLRVREEEEDVIYGTKARIPPSVRRRLKASRQSRPSQYHHDYVSPPPTTNYVEHKTDLSLRAITKPDPDIYPITITPSPFASHPKSVRASSIQLKTPTSSIGEEDYTPKPLVKIKSGRRRKVKRPAKIKPLVSNAVEEDIGPINNNNNNVKSKDNSTGSGGDKNLAVEIGQEDGKYALIDKFFDRPLSHAPGVLSYAPSDDFAHDNQHTLGNLKENDIWLSDGHLLVLKGGDLDTSTKEHWKPIDNYERDPGRPPLKIPVDSSNPPPFPVFVNTSGPPIFLGPPPPYGLPYPPPGHDGNGTFDPSRLPPPGLIPLYPNGSIPPEFLGPPHGGYGGGGGGNGSYPPFHPFPGGLPPPHPGQRLNGSFPHLPPFGYPPPPGFNGSLPPFPFIPFPPQGGKNGSFPQFLPPPPGFNPNFTGGPPPGFPLLPPLVLNPNDNETDDPSIFLPPPYDFDYEDGNLTLVPPGPFAPGLVVPPPKDFYTTYNKTKRYPSSSQRYPFDKRPQRPNGRKPKFPITPPPDDSLEALLPQTTPQPIVTITPHSKKRKRPGKTHKGLFGNTLPKFDSSQEIAGLPPANIPISEQILSPLVTAQPQITQTQPIVSIKNSTPKPHNNYVYVRGQLKTLQEIAAEHAQEQEGEYDYNPTPRPPYDERGYPTRVIDEHDPTIIEYAKKTTKAPAKNAYFNTPKYDNIYNVLPKRIKLKNRLNYQGANAVTPTVPQTQPGIYNHHHQQQHLFPSTLTDPSSQLHGHGHQQLNQHQNQLQNQHQNQLQNQHQNQLQNQHQHQQQAIDVYDPNFAEKLNPVRPDYYGNNGQQLQRPKQIIQLQSPKDYSLGGQRQPHSYDQGSIPQNNNPGSTGFRPAFGPNHRPGSQGSRLLYPGQVTQVGPIFNLQSPIFQQQKQSHRPQGYYSPITQYHQPIHPTHNDYYHHQPGALSPTGLGQSGLGQNHQYLQQPQVYEGEQQYQHQHQQPPPQQHQHQLQHYRNFGQGSLSQSPQLPSNVFSAQLNPYNSPQSQSQTSGLHQDPLLSYREPLPQYNTESEAVTSRAVLKAGPSQSTRQAGGGGGGGGGLRGERGDGGGGGSDGGGSSQGEDPSSPNTSAKDVSFFTFQRGGPGGFSYKIRI